MKFAIKDDCTDEHGSVDLECYLEAMDKYEEEITKKIITRLEARGHTLIVPAKEDDEEGVYYIGAKDELQE